MKIFRPVGGWTKDDIFGQLCPLYDEKLDAEISVTFTADEISDEIAQTWVDKHQQVLLNLPSEDRYIDKVIALNDELIIAVLGGDPRD